MMDWRSKRARFLLLMGVALAWRLILFVGPTGSDDLNYSESARQISEGDFQPGASIFSLRLGYVGAIGFVYALFGAGALPTTASPSWKGTTRVPSETTTASLIRS